ncbi:hypothetical protein ACS0TY_033377 [Phlomoides rotata]
MYKVIYTILDKRYVHEDETSSNNDSDMEIELCKRRSISKGKRSKLREYEKPAKRQECIPSRKRKRTKKTVSKCPGLLYIL